MQHLVQIIFNEIESLLHTLATFGSFCPKSSGKMLLGNILISLRSFMPKKSNGMQKLYSWAGFHHSNTFWIKIPKSSHCVQLNQVGILGFKRWGSFFWLHNKGIGDLVSGNGILLPQLLNLLWEKIVPVIEKNFWSSRLNLQKFWDH